MRTLPHPTIIPPDRNIPFVDADYRAIEGTGTIAAVRTALHAAEARHAVYLHPADDDRPYMDRTTDAWILHHLYPFLDDTHLTLYGGDLCNDVDICDAAGAQLGATWRDWGEIVADWANLRHWPRTAPRRAPWTYMDFYMQRARGDDPERYRDLVRVVRTAIGVDDE
jgi:hypothetical protein